MAPSKRSKFKKSSSSKNNKWKTAEDLEIMEELRQYKEARKIRIAEETAARALLTMKKNLEKLNIPSSFNNKDLSGFPNPGNNYPDSNQPSDSENETMESLTLKATALRDDAKALRKDTNALRNNVETRHSSNNEEDSYSEEEDYEGYCCPECELLEQEDLEEEDHDCQNFCGLDSNTVKQFLSQSHLCHHGGGQELIKKLEPKIFDNDLHKKCHKQKKGGHCVMSVMSNCRNHVCTHTCQVSRIKNETIFDKIQAHPEHYTIVRPYTLLTVRELLELGSRLGIEFRSGSPLQENRKEKDRHWKKYVSPGDPLILYRGTDLIFDRKVTLLIGERLRKLSEIQFKRLLREAISSELMKIREEKAQTQLLEPYIPSSVEKKSKRPKSAIPSTTTTTTSNKILCYCQPQRIPDVLKLTQAKNAEKMSTLELQYEDFQAGCNMIMAMIKKKEQEYLNEELKKNKNMPNSV